ncbi:unnamed protein product [Linum tenue]|uniref:WD repeat-containing protein 76 n=1 Tax=Linum tenue TaxID=586396 RepID=A0AAV0IE14_9ROSI|nr:unnamed protein product [Linum tenue]
MASKAKMTEYERKRLENIRRNGEMMAALKIQSKASLLSQSAKRQRVGAVQSKSYKLSPEKKLKPDSPVVIRRSLRSRGLPPEGVDGVLSDDPPCETLKISSKEKVSPRVLGPLSMDDAQDGAGSNGTLISTLLSIDTKPHMSPPVKEEHAGGDVVKKESIEPRDSFDSERVKTEGFDEGIKEEKKGAVSLLDLGSMRLETDNIARVVPGRIMSVEFLPCTDLRMVVVGNKLGNVGFWNMDSKGGDDHHNGIHLYRPHTGPISGIVFQESSFSKIFSSCYDGYIRMMDAEKEVFNLVHHTDEAIFCLSKPPNEDKGLYFGEGRGGLTVWDEKMGKASFQWFPHEDRINTIHFNPMNPNIMATGSTDGTGRIWDLRNVGSSQPKCLKMVSHNRAVHSAYFSPSGCSLATSSLDDHVGIHSGIDLEDNCMIPHDNQTGRWISKFRAIWGWGDAYLFIGNKKKGVDVISPAENRVVTTLKSSEMIAIPCRFDAHPHRVGMLAGGTGGGQVYVWTSS